MDCRNVRVLVVVSGLLGASVAPGSAGTISVAWDGVSGATGYRLYYGASSGQYTSSLDLGSRTEATLDGVADCTTWYVAVKAYNPNGESPQFSNEVSGWPRPVVETISPSSGMQGSQFTLDIRGANLRPGATVEVEDNPGVVLAAPAVLGCDHVQVLTTVEPMAEEVPPAKVGSFTVSVTNPDRAYGSSPGALEILINPARFDVVSAQGPSEGRLDGRDAILISSLFGNREVDAAFDPDVDFNGDGWIDGADLAYLAGNLGKCWSGKGWTVDACPEDFQ
jgi:hypothetical protein